MAVAAGLEAPAVRAQPQQAGAMKKALWVAAKLFVFGLTIWTVGEIEAVEAGRIHGGRAQVAVVAIMVICVAGLSPVEPMAEWNWNKKDDD